MTLLCVLVGATNPARAEDLPKLWNSTWAGYETQWGADFEKLLTAVQDKRFDEARQTLTPLTVTLAKLNLLAQDTVRTQERDTIVALRRVIVEESRRAAGRRSFFSEHDQDILKVLLSELGERATDVNALKRSVTKEQWRSWKKSLAFNGGVFTASGGVVTGGLYTFFATHHFRNHEFQTPTSWIAGALVGALATRGLWKQFPRFMSSTNLVAPVLDDCRRYLTN